MRYRYRNPVRRLFGGLYSILWLVIIIIFFATGSHFWVLFLIGALLSVLGIVIRLVTAGIIGAGIFGAASMMSNQQQQPPYQPYQQPYQPPQQPYQPYQQGYQPPPVTYQEGGQQYPNQPPQPQYEQPQAQYPQEMPPQQ